MLGEMEEMEDHGRRKEEWHLNFKVEFQVVRGDLVGVPCEALKENQIGLDKEARMLRNLESAR